MNGIYNDLKPQFNKIQKKLESLVKSALPSSVKSSKKRPKYLTNIKPLSSLKDKTEGRGKNLANIGDIVRGALLLQTDDEVNETVKSLKKSLGSKVVGYEVKDKGGDATFGYYGSHHFDIMIDRPSDRIAGHDNKAMAIQGCGAQDLQ